jgi:cytochrome P450
VVAEYQAELKENKVKAGTVDHTLDKYVHYLAKSIDAYRNLVSELSSASLTFPAQWKDIRELPYLDAVIRESMRLNPGIAMVFERVAPEGGYTLPDSRYIPAGTKVGINPAVTNRDYTVFGEDADVFRPDRWLKRDGESDEEYQERHRRMNDTCDFVFGGGGRICMGRYLAMLEIKKLIATLYSIFDVSDHASSFSLSLNLANALANALCSCIWSTRSTSGHIEMPGLCIRATCP